MGSSVRIVDVADAPGFGRIPPCADPGYDHRTCDYWEDAERGSKAARAAWLEPPRPASPSRRANPFGGDDDGPTVNPFAPSSSSRPTFNPFALDDGGAIGENPFAPRREARPTVAADAPRKLVLLSRGLAIFGTYAKVLEVDDEPVAYAQFGPLSAYPRAQRLRELYPRLPASPLPAVITCVATTPDARRAGHARGLVAAISDDLASRGFSAVEAYPERHVRLEGTSAATVEFWLGCGFALAVDDERYPVVRREL